MPYSLGRKFSWPLSCFENSWLKSLAIGRLAHLLWKDMISSTFLNMVSFWLLTSGGASGHSACFRWWEVKKSISLTNSDSAFIRSWISWLGTWNNSWLWCFLWFQYLLCGCRYALLTIISSCIPPLTPPLHLSLEDHLYQLRAEITHIFIVTFKMLRPHNNEYYWWKKFGYYFVGSVAIVLRHTLSFLSK